MILAADVGGTKADVAWFRAGPEGPECVTMRRTASQRHAGLLELLRAFLEDEEHPIDACCVGIAGPVRGGRVEATNLGWSAGEEELGRELGVERVQLVNDLVATAEGLALLGPEEVEVLHAAEADEAAELVVAPGTGLGVSFRVPRDGGWLALPSEAGHAHFAPRSEEHERIVQHLRRAGREPTNEAVVSGPGLVAAFESLADPGQEEPSFRERWEAEDRAALVTEYALQRGSRGARRATDAFASALGAVAADLVRIGFATGGVWIAGGIAPRVPALVRGGPFLRAFLAEGATGVVERVPVRLVREPHTPLRGAALVAARSLDAGTPLGA